MSYYHCGNGYPDHCNGYVGVHDGRVCLSTNHDMRSEDADGRQPCQAGDKRWAEPGRTACRFHRQFAREAEGGAAGPSGHHAC